MSFTSSNIAHLDRKSLANPQRMQLAEQWRQDWVVNAEEGTTVDDVLNPTYWASVATQFQVFDKIEVRLETGEWILELIVMSVGRTHATVYLAKRYDLKELADPGDQHDHRSDFEVIWRGIQLKFGVQRRSDKAWIQDGFKSKDLAQSWLENYERTIGSN